MDTDDHHACGADAHPRWRTLGLPLQAAIGVALVPLLTGATAAPPAGIDACALLKPDEIAAVVGEKVEAGPPMDNGITPDGAHSTTCIWAAPLAPGVFPNPALRLGGRGFVVVNIINWPGGARDAHKFLDGFQKAFREHDIKSKPVAVKVGADESLWWGDGVAARKKGISVGISVAQFGDRAARQGQAESLARLVVKRLPA